MDDTTDRATGKGEQQWLSMRLTDTAYAVEVEAVAEVVKYQHITTVPGSYKHVLGLINHRGRIVTIIDTGKRLGLSESELTDYTRIVIIRAGEERFGLLVDEVNDVVYLNTSDIKCPAVPRYGVLAQASVADKLLFQLDLQQLTDIEDES